MRRLLARDDAGSKTPPHSRPQEGNKNEWTEMNLKFVRGLVGNSVKITIFAVALSSLAKRRRVPRGGEMPGPVLEVIEPQ